MDKKIALVFFLLFIGSVSAIPITTLTPTPTGNWQNTDYDGTLNCTGADGNPCTDTTTYYTTDGSDPTTSSPSGTTITLNTEGTYTIKYFSKENAGESELIKTEPQQVKIDKTVPTTISDLTATTGTTGGSINATFTAPTDPGSGLNTTTPYTLKYSTTAITNDGEFTAATTFAGTISPSGTTITGLTPGTTYYFAIKSADNAGNVSAISNSTNAVAYLAVTPPTTTATGCNNSWNNSNQTITLTCAPGSAGACAGTRYKIDNGEWANYSASFEISSDGNHLIDFNSIDVAGNSEPVKTSHCAIDKTPPGGTISFSGSYSKTATPKILLNSTDSLSGMPNGKMQFSCGTNYSSQANYASEYTAFNITNGNDCNSGEGWKLIKAKFTDAVGNSFDTNAAIAYDITVPSVPANLAATAGNGMVSLNWTASTDSLSGIKDYNVYKDNVFAATTSSTIYTATGLANGTSYSFTVSARDNADNESAKTSAVSSTPVAPQTNNNQNDQVNAPDTSDDLTPPKISFNGISENQNLAGIATIKVSAEDSSGINFVSLYVDGEVEKNLAGKKTTPTNGFFEFQLDTSKWANGIHALILVSADNSANKNTAKMELKVKFNVEETEKEENKPAAEPAKKAEEKQVLLSLDENFENLNENSFETISLETGIKSSAKELLELLKPKRKIELAGYKNIFRLTVTVSFENTDFNSLKIVEILPKEFAENAELVESDIPFKIIVSDPIIEFDLNRLDSNKTIEIKYWLKKDLNKEEAGKISAINFSEKFAEPPLFLDSATVVEAKDFEKKPESQTATVGFFGLEKIKDLPLIAGLAIAGLIVFFVMKLPLPKIELPKSAIENENGTEKGQIENGTMAAGSENTTPNETIQTVEISKKKNAREKIQELDLVEKKIKELRKEGN